MRRKIERGRVELELAEEGGGGYYASVDLVGEDGRAFASMTVQYRWEGHREPIARIIAKAARRGTKVRVRTNDRRLVELIESKLG